MASTNQSPFYQRAEQEFQNASTDEERIACLEIMMKEVPKHKSSENMRKNLVNRYKKLKTSLAKQKKSGKSSQQGIKKADIQCVLIGLPNSGKSTIFRTLTGLNPKISPHPFTTYKPQMGTFKFENTPIQIIDDAPIPNQNKSLINSTDTLLIAINSPEQIKEIEKQIWKSPAKKIYIYNKTDLLNETELRKLKATLNSKYKKLKTYYTNKNDTETEKLKKEIFETFPIIRIYTKEPKKSPSKEPMILKQNSTLKNAAEKILKGMSKKIKRAKIWGPSSKFGGQTVGLDHILKDKDTIELQTK
jgi:ribosome-interacting GTPase 1